MTMPIQIYTFGKLLVERDGVALENFISTKAVLLLVYLALHPGEHSRKKLAALFWSETTDQQALKNLRTVLSNLRQQLDNALLVSHEDLGINPNTALYVDANHFSDGVKRVFASPITLDSLRLLQELEALYQGDFLANLAVREADVLNDWIDEQQRQFHEFYRRLLFEIVETARKQASYETGLDYARKLVNLDPFWESAQRQLLLLLAYTNHANDALLHYEAFTALMDVELQAEPEAETTALYERIRSRSISPPQQPGLSPLVLPDTPFVEPADDIELAQRMLNTPHCRLLTLYGISGIGKTALATQLAFHRQHRYRDGAHLISLNIAQTAPDALRVIAGALNLNFGSNLDYHALEDQVIEYLKTRELLLVFDNYEQLLPETRLIERVLESAVSVQMIVTSHTPLNLYSEWLLPLHGLSVPETGSPDPEEYEAIRLFELTAQRVNPRFSVAQSLSDIIHICRLVDSLPLGIILAAGWVQYIPPSDILAMMQQDLLQIEAIHHDLPLRHQSFHGLMNAMLAHLSAPEQQALICLSIFDGTFDVRAALAVADISLHDFKSLTNKSLIQAAEGYRYTIHNVLRQTFRTKLEQSAQLPQVTARFIAHFQAWCDDFFARGVPLHETMHLLETEQHNLWNVIGLSDFDRQRFLLHIAPAMTEYWVNRGYHSRGIIQLLQAGGANPDIERATRVRGLSTLARILERTSEYDHAWDIGEQVLALENGLDLPVFRARALRVLSEICVRQGQYQRADDYLRAIIAMESQTSTTLPPQMGRVIALAYEDLGEMLMSQGDYDAAQHYIEIALRRWVETREPLREAIARSYLGLMLLKQQRYQEAYQLFSDILSSAKQAHNQTLTAIFSIDLGVAATCLGDYGLACTLYREALLIAVQIDRKVSITSGLDHISRLAADFAYYDTAAQLQGFVNSLRERIKLSVSPHNQPELRQHRHNLAQNLSESFEPTYQAGQAMGLSTAIQLAQTILDQVQQIVCSGPSDEVAHEAIAAADRTR